MNQTLKAAAITNPTVAVIIPYYNGSKWIERAIKSVIDQTLTPNEFIIVNDGSRQEERDFLDGLAKDYPFTIIDKVNGGQGSARNLGVKVAESDFICFLDQDDFFLPNHIHDLVAALPADDPRIGFVYADLTVADGGGNVIFTTWVKERSPANPKRSLIGLLQSDMYILPSAAIISRSAFLAVGGFDEQFMGYEDDDLFLRLFSQGFTNHYLDKPVTTWCINGESTSYSIRMSQSRFRYFEKITKNFPDNHTLGLFYFRDCIVPRFAPTFTADAINAVISRSADRDRLLEIFRSFSKTAAENPHVSQKYKKKLLRTVWALENCPRSLLLLVRRLPVLRRAIA
jgi:glycosyltransferase involved in cell wall biosynthesis